MNILIKVTPRTNEDYEGCAEIEVLADGAKVAEGSIGGEPEDNRITRDYRWIVPALAAIGKACGATVTVEEVA